MAFMQSIRVGIVVVLLESVIFVGLPDAKIDFQAQEEVFSRQLKLPTRCNVLRATN